MDDADALIAGLDLAPHPEGGHYRETFRDDQHVAGRSAGTAIYYLLRRGERSALHRVDAAEIWHHYQGAPLRLMVGDEALTLGQDIAAGERPQIIVPRGVWQAAESLGAYTLAGCTVAPGFQFSGFELAEKDEPQGPGS